MSKSKGKGGTPKVFAVKGKDGTVGKVIARSPKAAKQIAMSGGFDVASHLNGKAVLATDLDPAKAIDAMNHRADSKVNGGS